MAIEANELRLLPGRHRRVAGGHPWIYSNEVAMSEAVKALAPGAVVRVVGHDGRVVGVGLAHPRSLVVCRMLSRDPEAAIDAEFFQRRLRAAVALRDRLYDSLFYRAVHAEADGFPGTIVDRFGSTVVLQINSAGMARFEASLVDAIDRVLEPVAIVLKNDGALRALEGLPQEVSLAKGHLQADFEIEENGVRFPVDILGGQKTGWYYDQRDNRAWVARLSRGRRVLDVFCHTGGFGVQAAAAGAESVTLVDRSRPALDLARRAAEINGVAERCRIVVAEAFAELERLDRDGLRFGIVVVDPPAFVKAKKDLPTGLKGYRKLAQLACRLVEPGGVLFAASCSHNVDATTFFDQVSQGLSRAKRSGRVLRQSGAGPDHPVHPFLPESAYLKGLLLQLD